MAKIVQKRIAVWSLETHEQIQTFSLTENYLVSKVGIIVGGDEKAFTDISVQYAQNGILSDLIPFGCISNKKVDSHQEIEIKTDNRMPVSASHIQVTLLNETCWIENVYVYEQIDEVEEDCVQEEVQEDADNIAFRKPVHTSSGKEMAANITDGSKKTWWQGEYYPAYIDIDLERNFYLDRIEIYAPNKENLVYRIYTSIDGRDFKESVIKSDDITHSMKNVEAKFVRIFIEYDAGSSKPRINLVRIMGTESNTSITERAEIKIDNYEVSEYNTRITEEDTYQEVFGIIERRIGTKYIEWFELELAEHPYKKACDYYELAELNNRIHVKGNNGVSLATGINHYLKYYCKVHVSQVGDQIKMPEKLVALNTTVFRETRAKVRYAYNYCTHSYTMAFWGEKEWRRELDWLALNGVNLILDITGQEEVWRRFLTKLGYQHEDIKDYIAGPAYYAWAYMANLYGFGGPVHDSWFEQRAELVRKNHEIMRKLGMYPVLQGYSGMVPPDITKYDEKADVIAQGTWCSFERPYMLRTTSECFKKYARLFYETQKEVYGDYSHHYATDPFHEGGITAEMSPREIGKEVLQAMIEYDKEAVWVIQSWQSNPTSELLEGVADIKEGKYHALILDLYAEKQPNYKNGKPGSERHGYEEEFNHTPWVFCMLNNFGGRLGMHGHLDNLVREIPRAWNQCRNLAGIGITPEASENNPILYDFLFETIWQENIDLPMQEICLEKWLNEYIVRRYGQDSHSAREAWEILVDTVYKAEYNNLGQGAPECVANARPALELRAASTWGNAIINYDEEALEKAALLLAQDYELLKNSKGYLYDLTTVRQQVLSNRARKCHNLMSEVAQNQEWRQFEELGKQFLALMDEMEQVLSSSEFYQLDRWIQQAVRLGENTDDFTKRLYLFNAKALITTWGSYHQAEMGKLHDYSNRQWSGLIKEFYKPRWEYWITNRAKQTEWFLQEWRWIWE